MVESTQARQQHMHASRIENNRSGQPAESTAPNSITARTPLARVSNPVNPVTQATAYMAFCGVCDLAVGAGGSTLQK